MLLKQFLILNNAFTFTQQIKNNYNYVYIELNKFHYNVVSGKRIKNFNKLVYFYNHGTLELNRADKFAWKIFQYENGTHS